jgi:carboxyl-terminal processing protease
MTKENNSTHRKPNGYLIPLGLTLALVIGLVLGEMIAKPKEGSAAGSSAQLTKLQNIMDQLDHRYVDDIDKDSLFESTIVSMLHQLDPHSNYIPAENLLAMRESIEGSFGGVGIRFTIIRDSVCVTHVIPNSPSYDVGVKAGDIFLQINGKPFLGKGVNNERVMKTLKGLANTNVNVLFLRAGKKIVKTITRGTIPIKSITAAYMISPGVGFIKLDEFSMTSAIEFREASALLKSRGMKKLIFDLRDNGGGVLQTAVQIIDEFLGDGVKIVSTKGRNSQATMYTATSVGELEKMKVVVLINQNSASASEIVAGALQDNDRAIVAGRRSFGKGLVQEDIGLSDKSNLRLTIARYYTPTGRCIQKPYNGIYEDYIMEENARMESGELYHVDSSLMVDSLKFKTPKGKIVYGGGGIMPDVFIPLDTMSTTWYLMRLRASGVFQIFAFDYLREKRDKMGSLANFVSSFNPDEKLLNEFLSYTKKETKIAYNAKEYTYSKTKIALLIKAEIARQIWQENGYFEIINKTDKEVLKALSL